MDSIAAVGFDMDHTLALYDREPFEQLTFDLAVKRLVAEFGYPESIQDVRYDRDAIIRVITKTLSSKGAGAVGKKVGGKKAGGILGWAAEKGTTWTDDGGLLAERGLTALAGDAGDSGALFVPARPAAAPARATTARPRTRPISTWRSRPARRGCSSPCAATES